MSRQVTRGGCRAGVQAKLLVRCEPERCVAVGRDFREFGVGLAVVDDRTNERHSALVVWRGQVADCEVMFASQQLNNVKEQGNGAQLLEAGPRGGRGSKRELRWSRETFAYQNS